jgi:hypothetical protein
MAPLEQQLFAAEGERFFNFYLIFLDRGDIRFLVSGSAVEITELTISDTDIRGIRIAVNNPGDHISGHMSLSQCGADVHQFGGGGIFEEEHPFFGAEPFEAQGALEEIRDMHSV